MKVDRLETPTEEVRLEIIPLIDVIFCILTFFILAAVGLTRQQALDLDLPAAATSEPLPAPESSGLSERFYVSIDAFGNIYYEQQQIDIQLLYDLLLQHQQFYPNGLIVLYASQQTDYGRVVQVLDLLRSVGGDRVALATISQDLQEGELELAPNPLLEGDPLLPAPSESDPFGTEGLDPANPFGTENLDPANPFGVPLEPESPESATPAPSAPLGEDE